MPKRPAVVGTIITFLVWVLVAGGLFSLVLGIVELASPSFARALPPFVLGAGILLGLALLAAMQDAVGEACEIYSDSEFWINVLTKWAPNWAANGWKKKSGEIKNLDIVKPLLAEYQNSRAKLIWVRGHVGAELNELADEWANRAREQKVRGVSSVNSDM